MILRYAADDFSLTQAGEKMNFGQTNLKSVAWNTAGTWAYVGGDDGWLWRVRAEGDGGLETHLIEGRGEGDVTDIDCHDDVMLCVISSVTDGIGIIDRNHILTWIGGSFYPWNSVICPNGVGSSEASKINGVEKVISVTGDCFNIFDGGAWASALSSMCGEMILISASPNGREIGSRIAAKKGIPIIQDVVSMTEGITVSRPIYSGKAMESLTISGGAVVTLRPNAFDAALAENDAPINVVNQSADVRIAIQVLKEMED